MSRRSIATPCPTTQTGSISFMKSLDETTTTLNFTTAFDASFRNVKPRRHQRLSVQFAIHEDQEAKQHDGKSQSINLAKPARRLSTSVSLPQPGSSLQKESGSAVNLRRESGMHLSQVPKRLPRRLSIVRESGKKEPTPESIPEDETKTLGFTIHAARPLRRRTIYIPNDETTMPSMYMGIFSPLKELGSSANDVSEPTMEMSGLAAQMAIKRGHGRRTSMIDAAPRRVPLQISTRKSQETSDSFDKIGQNGGKENVPPGLSECEKQMLDLNLVGSISASQVPAHSSQPQYRSDKPKSTKTSIYAPKTSVPNRFKARMSVSGTSSRLTTSQGTRTTWNAPAMSNQPGPKSPSSRHNFLTAKHIMPGQLATKPRVPSRFVVPVIQHDDGASGHNILADDISTPRLYEDNWLGHQEIAITQLLNKLFTAAQPRYERGELSMTLTQELLSVYNNSGVEVLHNRIQAAMLYGALSIPQDILDQGEAFMKDVGRRQKFIDLWISTYDRDALEAGLEVVVGRQCRTQMTRMSDDGSSGRSPTRKALHKFVDTFLLRNEDTRPDRTVRNRAAWSYQRTFLRSIMLIKILDSIKTSGSTSFCGPLFQSACSLKSSDAVLNAVFQMMNPAAGDPTRALNYIGYSVSHVQYPLEEFHYSIENLAVDLRDGVRLTRLVELLLYPTASLSLEVKPDTDATTTIIMPAGDSVDFQNGQDWPLSQHLKFPCPSRVARLWNVQIALSAIGRVKGMESMVDGITAEDIVDGFREKTIRLLWALVGKCGLASLINWTDVEWETRRLKLRTKDSTTVYSASNDLRESDLSDQTFESCKARLKNWVHAVAAAHGLKVHNFTTSFADGKIFEAIVDTYEPYLHIPPNTAQPRTGKESLSTRLARLGCSKQFADLFSHAEHIFDRDFVLAALAFLCSRFLAPTRGIRAASVIQCAWRTHWARIQATRNQTRKIMADACAEFVQCQKLSGRRETLGPVLECDVDGSSRELQHQKLDHRDIHSPVSEAGDIWLSL